MEARTIQFIIDQCWFYESHITGSYRSAITEPLVSKTSSNPLKRFI